LQRRQPTTATETIRSSSRWSETAEIRHITGDTVGDGAGSATMGAICAVDPQQDFVGAGTGAAAFDPQHEAVDTGAMRSAAGASNHPIRIRSIVPKPLSIPMPTAEIILVTAKPIPSVPAARMNCVGSISGEEIQNAMTGANGTPAPRRPATSGITPQEQNGRSAPISEATTIIRLWRPLKARAARASAPVAFAAAAMNTEPASQGPICASSPPT
jgi:hypothetical protein